QAVRNTGHDPLAPSISIEPIDLRRWRFGPTVVNGALYELYSRPPRECWVCHYKRSATPTHSCRLFRSNNILFKLDTAKSRQPKICRSLNEREREQHRW